MQHRFKFRTEMHIVATRMKMYENREKWQALIAKQVEAGHGVSAATRAVANGTKPRAVVVEITYPELDRTQLATDDNIFDMPGVAIREISVNDGLTLREFTLSIEEARKLARLLSSL